MKDLKTIIIAFLLGVSVFSAIRYVSSLKEQHMLQVNLQEKGSEISTLQNEKQNLLQEIGKEKDLNQKAMRINTLLKNSLNAGKSRLSRLFTKYNRAAEDNEQLNSQISILKAENAAVRSEGEKIKLELS
jgi:cell division protein FtsB